MLTAARLLYLMIYVRDLAVSRTFYEGALGFRPLEGDSDSVKYSAGHMILYLRSSPHFDNVPPGRRDRSIDITFLVDDLQTMRASLEANGVHFSPTLAYEVGKTADFYDPDGHWFSLYEPSNAAMTWPSGRKIEAFRAARATGARSNVALDHHDLVYLFLFVEDQDAALAFYNGSLGLEAIEGGPCRRGVTTAPAGVVKYDVGGTLLTTHLVEGDHAVKHRVTTRGSGGVGLIFHVDDLQRSIAELVSRGVEFTDNPTSSSIGTIARFEDPGGHVYGLCEPSAEVLTRTGASMIEQILAAPL